MLFKYGFAFLKHGSLWAYRLATWAVLVFGLGFAAAVIALRYVLLPDIGAYREPIAQAISGAVGQTVTIGRIEGSWRGYRPELRLFDVQVLEPGGQTALGLGRVDTVLSWVSLLAGQVTFHSLEISQPELEIRRDPLGVLWVAGDPLGGGASRQRHRLRNWLVHQRQVVVRDARITWIDEMRSVRPLVIEHASLRIDNEDGHHRFGLVGKPPVELASAIRVRGDLLGDDLGDLSDWRGRIYGEFEYANVALAATWVALPLPADSGLGALRLWLDVGQGRISGATADVSLVNVRTRLREDLPLLDLARLSGRLGWRHNATGTRLFAHDLALQWPDGQRMPAFDFDLHRGAGADPVYALSLSAIELAPLTRLAPFMPIDAALQGQIAAAQPGGRLTQARVAWRDAGHRRLESAQITFQALALQPIDALPGMRGISGTLSANSRGGTVSLKGEHGGVSLPRVFAEPIPLNYLTADADWKIDNGQVAVTLRNASFTNAHAAGSVSGSYATVAGGPGTIDLQATLVRAEARDVWRYIPNAAQHTRDWLQRALAAGRATGARLTLRGPLAQFPFRDAGTGQFLVTAEVEGVRLDYGEGWPALEDVSGELVFRSDELQIRARSGHIFDVDVGATQARIGGIGGHAEHLVVTGEGNGPVQSFLRFVSDSPVAGFIGHFTDRMVGDGSGHLSLKLDLPLHQLEDVRVSGRLQASGARFSVDPRVPDLGSYSTNLEFSEHDLTIRNGSARFLGGPLSFDGGKRGDDGLRIDLSGAVSAAGLADQFDFPVLRGLAGRTEWRGRLSMQDHRAQLAVRSALTGLSSNLPAPLDKAAAVALPLELTLAEGDGAQQFDLALGDRVSARLQFVDGVVRRGAVGFGAPALLPATDGMRIGGSLALLDVDAWRSALRAPAPDASRSEDRQRVALAGIDLAIGALDVQGRRFSNLHIAGQPAAEGWQVSVEAQQGKGQISWLPDQGGRLTARFSRLQIPAPASSLVTADTAAQAPPQQRTLPALDVVADDFSFEGKALGRLALLAKPEGRRWNLQMLAVSNPDGRLDISGQWMGSDLPRTDLEVRVQASNIGGLLSRLGYAEGIKGGSGSLSGPVSWVGAPYRPDLPTLSGRLKLQAKDGRFAKLEPGVAKLLGILSLQALPRRLSLDFRDLFSSGFSFETIDADVVLSNGVAQTDDFQMKGSAARVQMKGQVDLPAETQDLQVRIFPQLSTAAAVAGAVVNPAVGVATLVLQKALGDPVERLAAQEYHVTGGWTDPKVTRIARDEADTKHK